MQMEERLLPELLFEVETPVSHHVSGTLTHAL